MQATPTPHFARRLAVESSNIATLAYDPETFLLEVTFTNKSVYHYEGVTETAYCALLNAPSIGGHLAYKIKPSFGCKKIEPGVDGASSR